MGPRLRPALEAIAAYVPGRRPDVVADIARLASNETPFGPLPGVESAVATALGESHRYPDPGTVELREALAAYHRTTPDRVATGAGSVGLLQSLVQVAVDSGDEVVFAWRSFEAYPLVVRVVGGTPVPVPLRLDGTHDVEAMRAAVGERTRVVLLCSPNNPTGPALHRDDVRAFLRDVPDHVLVVLDEAYAEFVTDPAAVDGRRLLPDHPNLVVLRTFSKAYGLAGLRVGYALADPVVVAGLSKTTLPFSVSTPAQVAAVASLAADGEMRDRANRVVEQRTRLRDGLLAAGHDVPVSEGNFVWLPLGSDAQACAERLAAAGVLVRAFAGEGVRVTVGAPEEVGRVLGLLSPPPA